MLTILPLLVASFLPAPQAAPANVQAWSEDALHLIEALEAMHPDPFFGIPRADFDQGVDAFLGGLEGWTEPTATVEFLRLFALLSRSGREGHAVVWPMGSAVLPLQLYEFSDGWFVVGAPPELAALVGAHLTSIAGRPVEDVARLVAPLLCFDNEVNRRTKLARALLTVDLLEGLGVPAEGAGYRMGLHLADGTEAQHVVASTRPDHGQMQRLFSGLLPERPSGRWLQHRDVPFRMEVLESERALYVQFNVVTAAMDGGPTLAAFAQDMVDTFGRHQLARLIVDVRSNGGGDNTTFRPLIEALKTPTLDRPGVLFGLIGRATFSAAGNFATALQRETKATLIGEPTGGAPNQFGDARTVELPHHRGLLVRIATRYHVFSDPGDPRLTNEPDVVVSLASSDYFQDRDPVLERALTLSPR